jgi:hypothetical protein
VQGANVASPWMDKPLVGLNSTFSKLQIPAYSGRSVSQQNSPRTITFKPPENNYKENNRQGRPSERQRKHGASVSGPRRFEDAFIAPEDNRNKTNLSSTDLTTQVTQTINNVDNLSSEEPVNSLKDGQLAVNLEHKRSFNMKKTKPKLMRNRTFDVIETKMQNLPVIDLEVDD